MSTSKDNGSISNPVPEELAATGGTVDVSDEDDSKQCIGPGCIYEARPNSRYCSDECGIQFAMK